MIFTGRIHDGFNSFRRKEKIKDAILRTEVLTGGKLLPFAHQQI
jgi:hypothetical protein